ncbi:hypothetical protein [Paraburkholderia sacchari]|uniref:hypothetical protein n=1 Tax=Paraburkholderia sacchari TaxID=159450 RepID=UPI0039A74619
MDFEEIRVCRETPRTREMTCGAYSPFQVRLIAVARANDYMSFREWRDDFGFRLLRFIDDCRLARNGCRIRMGRYGMARRDSRRAGGWE